MKKQAPRLRNDALDYASKQHRKRYPGATIHRGNIRAFIADCLAGRSIPETLGWQRTLFQNYQEYITKFPTPKKKRPSGATVKKPQIRLNQRALRFACNEHKKKFPASTLTPTLVAEMVLDYLTNKDRPKRGSWQANFMRYYRAYLNSQKAPQ